MLVVNRDLDSTIIVTGLVEDIEKHIKSSKKTYKTSPNNAFSHILKFATFLYKQLRTLLNSSRTYKLRMNHGSINTSMVDSVTVCVHHTGFS